MCRAIGRHGAKLLADGQGVLTHCNAGGLATADYGTALAVLLRGRRAGQAAAQSTPTRRGRSAGRRLHRLGAAAAGLDVTLICDSMAAQVMREGRVQAVVTGADRIAANGDTANKIGTYGVAVAGRRAPDSLLRRRAERARSTCRIASGAEIPDRAAQPARDHARLRPPDRAGGREGLQSGLRRDARRVDRGHHLRARRYSAGDARSHRRNACLAWCFRIRACCRRRQIIEGSVKQLAFTQIVNRYGKARRRLRSGLSCSPLTSILNTRPRTTDR